MRKQHRVFTEAEIGYLAMHLQRVLADEENS